MQHLQHTPICKAILLALGAISFASSSLAQTAVSADADAGTSDKTLETVTVVGTVEELQSLDFYAPTPAP